MTTENIFSFEQARAAKIAAAAPPPEQPAPLMVLEVMPPLQDGDPFTARILDARIDPSLGANGNLELYARAIGDIADSMLRAASQRDAI